MIESLAALTLTVHLASYHTHGHREEFNEVNPGIGLQVGDWRGDVFRDSRSNMAAGFGRVFDIDYGDITLGVTAGLYHHTEHKGLFAVPFVKYKSARFTFIPGREGVAVGISVDF